VFNSELKWSDLIGHVIERLCSSRSLTLAWSVSTGWAKKRGRCVVLLVSFKRLEM